MTNSVLTAPYDQAEAPSSGRWWVFERTTATRQDAPRPRFLQAKLEVGRSGDETERETDRVAAAAMSPLRSPLPAVGRPLRVGAGPTAVVQRQPGPGKGQADYELLPQVSELSGLKNESGMS